MALIGKRTGSTPAGSGLVLGKVNPLSDPRMRMLVRSAVTQGNYGAVQHAYAHAQSLVPPASELWPWWLDGLESLASSGDQDLGLFVRFTATSPASPPGATSRRPRASGFVPLAAECHTNLLEVGDELSDRLLALDRRPGRC